MSGCPRAILAQSARRRDALSGGLQVALRLIASMTRRILFWIHLGIGVVAGAAILVMSATGVSAGLRAAGAPVRRSRPADGQRSRGRGSAPSGRDAGHASRRAPARCPPAWSSGRSASASVEFTFGRDRNVYVDPYTGAVLGEGSKPAREFFAAVERWHRTLGEPLSARGPLRAVAAASNLLFLLLVVTGLYLWLPRRGPWPRSGPTLLLSVGPAGSRPRLELAQRRRRLVRAPPRCSSR